MSYTDDELTDIAAAMGVMHYVGGSDAMSDREAAERRAVIAALKLIPRTPPEHERLITCALWMAYLSGLANGNRVVSDAATKLMSLVLDVVDPRIGRMNNGNVDRVFSVVVRALDEANA